MNKKAQQLIPSKKEILFTLEKSGYLLEQSLAPIFEEYGYVTDTNYHFLDPDEGKSREMDIRGYTIKKISRRWFSHSLSIYLIVSCKTNSEPLIFFSRQPILPAEYFGGEFFMLGNPNKIPGREKEPIDIQDFINIKKFHHFYKISKISSQFCAVGYVNKQVEIKHLDYTSEIIPLIKALDFEIKQTQEKEVNNELVNYHVFYPIWIVSGMLYACNTGKDRKIKLKKTNHVSYLQTYNSTTLKGEFRIDVIQENYLRKFLRVIDNETDEIAKRLNHKLKKLIGVIKKTEISK